MQKMELFFLYIGIRQDLIDIQDHISQFQGFLVKIFFNTPDISFFDCLEKSMSASF